MRTLILSLNGTVSQRKCGPQAEGWHLIERHVCWLLNEGYARLVRIEVVG